MLRPEVRHIFRTERPTNFKRGVQMEDEDPYLHNGPSPARSKVKNAISRGASDRYWPISLEWKVPETSKIGKYVTDATNTNAHQFQGQKVKGQARVLLRLNVNHIYRKGRLRNFKSGTPIEHALSIATASYEELMKLGSCMRADAYRVSRTGRTRRY